jgi:hypothetical protein
LIGAHRLALAHEIAEIAEQILPRRSLAMLREWLNGATYREIGQAHGMGKERARLVVNEALGLIRHRIEATPRRAPWPHTC